MAEQKQDDQHEHTFSNYVRIRDVVQKTCQRRWTIAKSGERGSGISVLPARHDDDDDLFSLWYDYYYFIFSQQCKLMTFQWRLSNSKSPQASSQYLTDLNNSMIWMISIRPPIYNFSNPLSKLLKIVPIFFLSFPIITIGVIITFNINSFFFNSLARYTYFTLFSLSLIPILWSPRTVKSTTKQVLFFG